MLAFADRSVVVGVVGSAGQYRWAALGSTGYCKGEIVGGNAILVPVPLPPLPLPLQCTLYSRLPIRQAACWHKHLLIKHVAALLHETNINTNPNDL